MMFIFRRKERLALVLLGIFLVSLAAGLSAATARSVQGSVDEELARNWRTDYDILVRPQSVVSKYEESGDVINGRFQSNNFFGHGITLEQLERIRAIAGVEVAAPLAVVGPATAWDLSIPLLYQLSPGIYQEVITVADNNGIEDIITTYTRFFLVDPEDQEPDPSLAYQAGLHSLPLSFSAHQFTMGIVAVDYQAEAALHGLDQAMIWGSLPTGASYESERGVVTLPMLINSAYGPQGNISVNLSRLDLAPNMATVKRLAQAEENLLARSKKQSIQDLDLTVPFTLPEPGELIAYSKYLAPEGLSYTTKEGQLALIAENVGGTFGLGFFDQYLSGVHQKSAPNQWFRRVITTKDISSFGIRGWSGGALEAPLIEYTYAGMFDPDRLAIMPRTSPVASPLEIYRQGAEPVQQGPGGAAVPTGTYTKSLHPYDFVGAPIAGLIPIEAIPALGSVGIDSVRVRVSGVDDMSDASQLRIAYIARQIAEIPGLHVDIVLGSSQQRTPVSLYAYDNQGRRDYLSNVQAVLAEPIARLEEKTGLTVRIQFATYDDQMEDIRIYKQFQLRPQPWIYLPRVVESEVREEMEELVGDQLAPAFSQLGFSGHQFSSGTGYHREITILIPEYVIGDDEPRDLYGVIEQYWIKMGTQMRIYQETNRGTFWITLGLLAVGALFIGNTTYISAVGRTGEFSALRSLGWRRSTVFRVSLTETLLISLLAGVVTAGVLALVWLFSDSYLESWLLIIVAPAVVLTFLMGSLPPLLGTLLIPPLRGVRQGELKTGARIGGGNSLGFILRGLLSRPGRTFITTLGLLIPAGTLAFIIFIYFGIQSVLGETLLGEYLALELKGYHFVLNALVFAVAGLAVTDTLLINLRERRKEFGLLKAVGWRSQTIAGILLGEGLGLGLLGGILGTAAAGAIYFHIFEILPPNPWLIGSLLALAPALVGGIAAILPAFRAAKIPAAQAIRED